MTYRARLTFRPAGSETGMDTGAQYNMTAGTSHGLAAKLAHNMGHRELHDSYVQQIERLTDDEPDYFTAPCGEQGQWTAKIWRE